jgi:hypothetical protein
MRGFECLPVKRSASELVQRRGACFKLLATVEFSVMTLDLRDGSGRQEKAISYSLQLRKCLAPFVRGALLALLLFAVPALSTLAKNSWYLPQSNPVHYLNIASKMQVPHCPVILERAPLRAIVDLLPVPPVTRSTREPGAEPPKPSLGVIISLQHRSPPSLFL